MTNASLFRSRSRTSLAPQPSVTLAHRMARTTGLVLLSVLGLGVVLGASLVPGEKTAHAASPKGTPRVHSLADTLPKDAKAEYDDAFVLVQNSDFAGALAKFDAAYKKFPDPRLLWNMATCEKNLKRYGRALTLVRRYQKEGASLLSEADQDEATAVAAGLQSLTTTLTFKLAEPGTKVYLDGEEVDPKNPLLVNVGEHTVTAKKDDFAELTQKVSGPGNGTFEVVIAPKRLVHEAKLSVHAHPGDTILLDGKVVGTGSFTGTVPSGGHTLKVTASGFAPSQQEITLRDLENRDLSVTLEKERGSVLPWVLVGIGVVAAAGATTGIYFAAKPGRESGVPAGTLPPSVVNTGIRF